jgi:hypothetical protein
VDGAIRCRCRKHSCTAHALKWFDCTRRTDDALEHTGDGRCFRATAQGVESAWRTTSRGTRL